MAKRIKITSYRKGQMFHTSKNTITKQHQELINQSNPENDLKLSINITNHEDKQQHPTGEHPTHQSA